MPIHTPPTCAHVYKNKHGFRLYRMEGPPDAYRGLRCLHLGKWFSQQIKHTHTHKDHIQSSAEAMGANVNPLFQRVDPDIIHSPSVCVSLSLRCPEVYKIIHSSYLQSLRCVTHTRTHTLKQATLLSPLLSKKIEGFGG